MAGHGHPLALTTAVCTLQLNASDAADDTKLNKVNATPAPVQLSVLRGDANNKIVSALVRRVLSI